MSMTMSLPMTMCIPHQPVAMRLPPRDMSDVCGYESVASRHQMGEHQETSTGAALLVAETGTEPVAAIDIVACDATMAAGEEVVVNVDKIEVASPAGLATMGAACDTLPQDEVVACQGELLCALRDNRSNERKRNRARTRTSKIKMLFKQLQDQQGAPSDTSMAEMLARTSRHIEHYVGQHRDWASTFK